jgi:hypothetical protein
MLIYEQSNIAHIIIEIKWLKINFTFSHHYSNKSNQGNKLGSYFTFKQNIK